MEIQKWIFFVMDEMQCSCILDVDFLNHTGDKEKLWNCSTKFTSLGEKEERSNGGSKT